MRPQPQHFVKGEPFRPALGFRQTLRQIGIGLQHPAKMGAGDRNQIAGDFPGREQPQLAPPILAQTPPGQIVAPGFASPRHGGKTRGRGRRPQFGQSRIGVDVEVGRKRLTAHDSRMCCVFAKVSQNATYGRKGCSRHAFSQRIRCLIPWILPHFPTLVRKISVRSC